MVRRVKVGARHPRGTAADEALKGVRIVGRGGEQRRIRDAYAVIVELASGELKITPAPGVRAGLLRVTADIRSFLHVGGGDAGSVDLAMTPRGRPVAPAGKAARRRKS